MTRAIQSSFTSGELAPSLHGRHDMAKYHAGAAVLRNFVVHPHGGASNRPGTHFVAVALGNGRLIPFVFSSGQAYVLEFGDEQMRVLADGGVVIGSTVSSPYAIEDLPLLQYAQSADVMFLAHPDYPAYELRRTDAEGGGFSWEFVELAFGSSVPGLVAKTFGGAATEALIVDGYGSLGTPTFEETAYLATALGPDGRESPVPSVESVKNTPIPGEWPTGYLMSLRANDVTKMWDSINVVPSASSDELLVVYGGAPGFGPGKPDWFQGGRPGRVFLWHLDAGGTVRTRELTDLLAELGTDDPPPGPVAFSWRWGELLPGDDWDHIPGGRTVYANISGVNTTSIEWGLLFAGPDQTGFRFYKRSRGVWGMLGESEQPFMIDDNVAADVTIGPPREQHLFGEGGEAGAQPSTVALFQQRLVYARTRERPRTVWASVTGDLRNFSVRVPLRDDDALQISPASGRVDEILHLVPFTGLVAFTGGAEWLLNGDGSPVGPFNVNFQIQSYHGAAVRPSPLPIGKSVVFVTRGGRAVRDLFYDVNYDSYAGTDLSVLANHLFEDHAIVDWAYQAPPEGVVWCVRADGVLLGLTYLREHEVYAWHRHDTQGLFRSVAAIPGALEDEVYVIVEREQGGQTRYYVERFTAHRDRAFLDCHLIYEGSPTQTVSGLGHLEGLTVGVLADDNVVEGLVVESGEITLPEEPASKIIVGLPYESDIQTLDMVVPDRTGQAGVGQRQRQASLLVRLHQSRGLLAGPSFDQLVELPFRSFEGYNESTEEFTGYKQIAVVPQWDRTARVCLRQKYPLPCTILSISPEVFVGG